MTEMSLASGLGAEIFAPADNTPAYLFGEDHDRYLVAVSPDQEEIFRAELTEAGMDVTQVGLFTEDVVRFKVVGNPEQTIPPEGASGRP